MAKITFFSGVLVLYGVFGSLGVLYGVFKSALDTFQILFIVFQNLRLFWSETFFPCLLRSVLTNVRIRVAVAEALHK